MSKHIFHYTNELLFSTLDLVLAYVSNKVLTHENSPKFVPLLQLSIKLGYRYIPAIQLTLTSLRKWLRQSPYQLKTYILPHILSLLKNYIKPLELTTLETNYTIAKTSKSRIKTLHMTKVLNEKEIICTDILHFIGQIGGNMNELLISSSLSNVSTTANLLHKQILFTIPYPHIKIDVYLDHLIPSILYLLNIQLHVILKLMLVNHYIL